MSEQQNVIFRLDDVEYGIDIMQVNEIIKMQNITKMPNTPEYVEGVTNLRGKVIPIINLRAKFNLTLKERDEDTRIIVIIVKDKALGVIVDEVAEVVRINDEEIDDSSTISADINDDYIKGVAKVENRLIIILNLERIF